MLIEFKKSYSFKIIISEHGNTTKRYNNNNSVKALKNNFELSSIRACRVLDYFANNGFKKESMTAVGYGEARPIVPNRDEAGNPIPANQSQNRRVVIKIIKADQKSIL